MALSLISEEHIRLSFEKIDASVQDGPLKDVISYVQHTWIDSRTSPIYYPGAHSTSQFAQTMS